MSSTYFDTSDLDAAAIAIHRFANYIDDGEVLQGAKRIAMDDMKRRFDTELDPTGAMWTELTESYQRQKAEDNFQVHPILTRTRALREAATSEEAWSVSGESVWFHTGGLPPYWEAHEIGRDFIEGPNGPYGGMPERRFIGLSEEARDEILALVGIWIEDGLAQTVAPFKSRSTTRFGESFRGGIIFSMFPGAGGKLQYRVSGKGYGGRFGPMV